VRKVLLTISVVPGQFAVCRLGTQATVPAWATLGPFFSVTRTADELSVVCLEQNVPPEVKREPGWRLFKLEGPFDFGLTGIVVSVALPLAEAGVSIFALSTYDTDYILVREFQFEPAIAALAERGHRIQR
jgi:uncharacterized protein